MRLMSAPCITHVYDDFNIKINKIEDIFPEIFFSKYFFAEIKFNSC